MGWKGHSVRELAQGDLADASSPFYQALARFHKPEEINPQQATRKFGDFDRMRQWGDCNVFVTLDKTGHITSTATAFSIPASRSLYGQRVGVIEYVATVEGQEGHSYGRAATEECLAWFRSINTAVVELYCKDEHVGYYGSMGFHEVGTFLRLDLPHLGSSNNESLALEPQHLGCFRPMCGTWFANGHMSIWMTPTEVRRRHYGKSVVAGYILPTFLHGGKLDIGMFDGVHVPLGDENLGKETIEGCLGWMRGKCYRVGVGCDVNDARMLSFYEAIGFKKWQRYMRMYL